MNTELNKCAKCYGCYNEQNEIIGFCAVLHQPHNKLLNLKRVHRLVILPDYQGIGIGTKFLNVIAKHYKQQGFEFCIVTSAKNMIYSLYHSNLWRCSGYRKSNPNKCSIQDCETTRTDNLCGRFMYKTKTYM